MDLHLAVRAAGRVALCAGALTTGVALARFTDAGRPSAAHASVAHGSSPSTGHALETLAATRLGAAESDVRVARPAAEGARSERYPEDPTGRRFGNGRIITGDTKHRLLLFTFDDGPDPRTTPILLDHLDRAGIKAIFFVTTGRFEEGTLRHQEIAELAREIVRRGHMLGHHTVTHPQLPLIDHARIVQEVDEGRRMIEEAIGFRPWLFRPPGGARSPRVDRILAERGYTTVLWNLGAGDFQVHTADDVVHTFRRVLDRQERDGVRGGIVLLHDTHPWSVEAFPRILAEIRERNCTLLADGEELFDIVDDLTLFHEPRMGADPSTIAHPPAPAAPILAARQRELREEYRARCDAYASR